MDTIVQLFLSFLLVPAYLLVSTILVVWAIMLLVRVVEPKTWALPQRLAVSIFLIALLPAVIVCIPGIMLTSMVFGESVVDKMDKIRFRR